MEIAAATYETKESWELSKLLVTVIFHSSHCGVEGKRGGGVVVHTVFFFARSPEAPRTTMTVLSLSSMVLRSKSQLVMMIGMLNRRQSGRSVGSGADRRQASTPQAHYRQDENRRNQVSFAKGDRTSSIIAKGVEDEFDGVSRRGGRD